MLVLYHLRIPGLRYLIFRGFCIYVYILFCRNPMSNLVKPGSRVNQLQQNRPLPTERRSHVRVR